MALLKFITVVDGVVCKIKLDKNEKATNEVSEDLPLFV